jgi:rod shape-determining protein MreC
MRRIFALIVIVLVSVLFIGRNQFIVEGKFLGTAALSGLGSVITSSNSGSNSELAALREENASLRVQLFDQSLSKPNTAKVYSDYPLNSKQEISIATGSDQGVKQGATVTWGNNVLIGKVITALGDSSIVSTIFDPSWQMAVRIGSSQIDGLLKGGNCPTVILIPQNGQINVGDVVVTAASGFPYGLEVGAVKEIRNTPNSVFREATLQTEVNIADLRDVTVHN